MCVSEMCYYGTTTKGLRDAAERKLKLETLILRKRKERRDTGGGCLETERVARAPPEPEALPAPLPAAAAERERERESVCTARDSLLGCTRDSFVHARESARATRRVVDRTTEWTTSIYIVISSDR